jgi:hypothetical protein
MPVEPSTPSVAFMLLTLAEALIYSKHVLGEIEPHRLIRGYTRMSDKGDTGDEYGCAPSALPILFDPG